MKSVITQCESSANFKRLVTNYDYRGYRLPNIVHKNGVHTNHPKPRPNRNLLKPKLILGDLGNLRPTVGCSNL